MAAMFVCPQCGENADEAGLCSSDQEELRDAQGDEHLGLTLGPYRIARLLGSGGMGRVYLAVHPGIGSRVAIKIFSRDTNEREDLVDRFFAEARATNLIGHENIINVLDVNRLENGRPYLVMEHLRGLPLSQLIGSDKLTDSAIAQIMLDVLDGLDAAHSLQIFHRDLKPDNIFVSPTGTATLLDFGVAKLVPETMGETGLTTTGTILGTPHYMAPEQAVGDPVDARTDIYALGVILFECFTGQRPFSGTSLYVLLDQHVHTAPPNPSSLCPTISEEVEAVILRALAKKPEDRFQNATEMKNALEHCILGPRSSRSMRIRIQTADEEAHADEVASTSANTVGSPKRAPNSKESPTSVDAPGSLGSTVSTVSQRPKGKRKLPLPFIGGSAGSLVKKRLDLLFKLGAAMGAVALIAYFALRDDRVVKRANPSSEPVPAETDEKLKDSNRATHTMPSLDGGTSHDAMPGAGEKDQ